MRSILYLLENKGCRPIHFNLNENSLFFHTGNGYVIQEFIFKTAKLAVSDFGVVSFSTLVLVQLDDKLINDLLI